MSLNREKRTAQWEIQLTEYNRTVFPVLLFLSTRREWCLFWSIFFPDSSLFPTKSEIQGSLRRNKHFEWRTTPGRTFSLLWTKKLMKRDNNQEKTLWTQSMKTVDSHTSIDTWCVYSNPSLSCHAILWVVFISLNMCSFSLNEPKGESLCRKEIELNGEASLRDTFSASSGLVSNVTILSSTYHWNSTISCLLLEQNEDDSWRNLFLSRTERLQYLRRTQGA